MVTRRTTEGLWITLGILCSGLLSVCAFVYSMYVSALGSAVVGMPQAIVQPYQIRSWTAFDISAASAVVCRLLVVTARIKSRRPEAPP